MADTNDLRALSQAATPGRWFDDPADEPGRVSAVETMAPVAQTVARATSYGRKEADAAFIAAAVNYVRALFAAAPAPAPGDEGLPGPDVPYAEAERIMADRGLADLLASPALAATEVGEGER